MSVAYGGPAGGYAPPGRVNFGWIGEAWQFFSRAAGLWIVAVLLYGIVNAAVNGLIVQAFPNPHYVPPPSVFGGNTTHFGIQYGTNSNVTAAGQVFGALFSWIFGAFQASSLYRIAVKQVRGEPVGFGDLVGGGAYFGNMLILNLVLFFFYIAGLLALCLGIFVVAAFFLPAEALIADGRSVGEAITESIQGMKKDWLTAALFFFVFVLLIVASVIPCGLGLFVTIPMVYIVSVLAYRDMIGMPGLSAPASPFGAPYGSAPGMTPGVWPPPPGAVPPPSFQPSTSPAPPAEPPRRSLGGEPMDETPPPSAPQ